MKIKAAVVDKKGTKFDNQDDVELADMQADDLLIHMVPPESATPTRPYERVTPKLATRSFWVMRVPGSLRRSAPRSRTSSREITSFSLSTAVVTVSTA